MKYVDLAQHLHELRLTRSGRPVGAAMSVSEVWQCALDSHHSSIKEIFYYETELPEPFEGLFIRLRSEDEHERAAIYVHKDREKHWKEFIAIKEIMHCWSSASTYVGTPDNAKRLISALASRDVPYLQIVAADVGAILAAGEVILPHHMVERHIAMGHDNEQIAVHHGLHPDITRLICSLDFLHMRKNGSLG